MNAEEVWARALPILEARLRRFKREKAARAMRLAALDGDAALVEMRGIGAAQLLDTRIQAGLRDALSSAAGRPIAVARRRAA